MCLLKFLRWLKVVVGGFRLFLVLVLTPYHAIRF